ncbi:MAG: outer membrane beta-barrel protein [Comamonadaceae bacterium]|nr:outer membrane beta-barrel protein [Pseudomonadota bacterium]MBS0610496.1 outer membrane beta-barrel protein [Pseudomonadota bacterium]MDE2413625.1 outer membrane beta-barrel protein [Comamonadaceae bacterium]
MQLTIRFVLYAALLGCTATSGLAQTRTATSGSSPIPGMSRGYMGLSAGISKYDLRSGTGGFTFDDSDTSVKLYTGAFFHPNLGLELGYVDLGRARRIGGNTSARGLNLSLVGRLPVTTQLDLLGKLGTIYGRTHTEGFGGYGVQPGKGDGFGLSYGAGLRWAFTPQWSAVLEWERYRLHFADRNSDVDTTTLGLQYSY